MPKVVFNVKGDLHSIRDAVDQSICFIKDNCINVDCDCLFEVRVILNEVLTNAMKHVHSRNPIISVTLEVDENKKLYLIVKDNGDGYNYSLFVKNDKNFEMNIMEESGRGILIVKNLCDELNFNKKGNKVMISKSLVK